MIAAAVRRLNGSAPLPARPLAFTSSLEDARLLIEIAGRHGWKIKAWGDPVEGFVASCIGSDGQELKKAHAKTKALAICEAFLAASRLS